MAATYNSSNGNVADCVLLLDAGNTKSYPGTGTSWFDISGKGNTATMYGTVPFATDLVKCWDFTTATGGFSYSANMGFTFATNMIPVYGNFIFSSWVKTSAAAGSQYGMFSNAGGGNGYRYGPSSNSTYVLGVYPYAETSISHPAWNTATWHHSVAVYDREGIDASGTPKVYTYVDGVNTGSLTITAPQVNSTTAAPGIVRNACCILWTGKLAYFSAHVGHWDSLEVLRQFSAQRSRFGI